MKKRDVTIADEIVQGLTEFAGALEDGGDLGERFTCRRVVLDLRPEPFTPERVRDVRRKLKVSQALFAKFLGVSIKTVCHWEQGLSEPSKMACRFMDEIGRDPAHYLSRLAKETKPKPKLPEKSK